MFILSLGKPYFDKELRKMGHTVINTPTTQADFSIREVLGSIGESPDFILFTSMSFPFPPYDMIYMRHRH
ncbi:MAG: hypothetical protein QMD71_04470 [bacterium]|nr:hypothetical protein [bacterium]